MGKGDQKTRKGKIFAGSHGNVRPHSPKSPAAVKSTTKPRTATTHAAAKKASTKKAAPRKAAS